MDLFFDTETTGFPNKKSPLDDPSQPHLVQLGAVLCDGRVVRAQLDLIVNPGVPIPEKATAVHGITDEMAAKCGVDPPDSLADLAQVDQVLNDLKVPFGNRISVVNPKTKADMMSIDAVTHAEKRGDDGTTLREASIGRVMGIDWYMGQNVYQHTAGTFSGGTPAVNSVVAAGETTMDIDGGAAAETIKAGDVFTVAGHDGWYGVFTADKTASTGAISGATFTPGAPTGGFADGDLITIVGSHSANLAFHPNAFALAVVPLELPRGTDKASYINYQGMGIRVVFGYDNNSKKDTISFDVLCGAKCIDPRLAVRILG